MTPRNSLFSFFVLFFLFSPSQSSFSSTADDLERFEHAGRERSYHIHVPETGKGPFPVVLVFHGALENAYAIERTTGFTDKSLKERFIIVYPNGTNENDGATRNLTFNGSSCCGYADAVQIDDVGFVRALIEKLKREYNVDSKRIYATGFSNGALLSYRLACELSDIFAAVAPVSGSLGEECSPENPVAVLAFHGTSDLKVLYDGGKSPVIYGSKYNTSLAFAREFWTKNNGCDPQPQVETIEGWTHETFSGCKQGRNVEFYILQDGDHDWPYEESGVSATDTIWEFFKNHPKQGSADRRQRSENDLLIS